MKKNTNMIPKRIFYVWGANEKKRRDVQICIESWRQIMPDYEIIEINENSKKYFNYKKELKENKWFRTVYTNKMWAYVADYIRIKVLYEHGGIYFDTDVSAVKTLNKFLKDDCFVGMQDSATDGNSDYVEPAILGAKKGNKFIKFILDIYNEDIWKLPIYTMPELFFYGINTLYKNNVKSFGPREKEKVIKYKDITIYPEVFFIPFRVRNEFNHDCINKNTHTIHWFNGSWCKPEIWYFLNNKHKIPLEKFNLPINCVIKEYRYTFPFFKKTILKTKIYENVRKTTLFHVIPLLSITKKWVKLFGFLPIMSVKQG